MPPTGNSSLEAFLASTLTDGGELTTAGTPQNQALVSLQTNFPDLDPNEGEAAQTEILQVFSLNTLYFSTNGTTSWADKTGWTGPDPVCTPWFGVTCDSSGLVTAVDLTSNDLVGELTSEIRGLANLRT
jgi:hypothetical protein